VAPSDVERRRYDLYHLAAAPHYSRPQISSSYPTALELVKLEPPEARVQASENCNELVLIFRWQIKFVLFNKERFDGGRQEK
jgi:hypothetical protein